MSERRQKRPNDHFYADLREKTTLFTFCQESGLDAALGPVSSPVLHPREGESRVIPLAGRVLRCRKVGFLVALLWGSAQSQQSWQKWSFHVILRARVMNRQLPPFFRRNPPLV